MDDIERRLKDLGDRAGGDVAYREVSAARIVRRARLRRAFLVVAPTAAAVFVAAVAYPAVKNLSDNDGVRVAGDLGFAAAATEEAGSARVEVEFEMSYDGGTTTTSGVGEVDFDRRRSHLLMETTGFDVPRVEMITIGEAVYQRTLGGPGEDASKWSKMDVPEGQGAFGAATGPTDFLAYLESFTSEVTDLGEEELEGIPVRHYRLIIDPTKVPGNEAGTDFDFEPMDVWVDERDRLRKLTFGSRIEDGSVMTMQMTMRMWDFGVPVDVRAPDPDDVTDEPLRAEVDRISNGDEELHEFGTSVETSSAPGTTFVYGKNGPAGPFLTLTGYGDPRSELLCVQGMPQGATGATLTHEETFETVATFAPRRARGKSLGVACAPPGFGHDDVDALLANPSEYLLRIERQRGPTVVVPLTTGGMPLIEE